MVKRMPPEVLEYLRTMGKAYGKLGGRTAAQNLTPELHLARAKKASLAAAKKRTAERLARLARSSKRVAGRKLAPHGHPDAQGVGSPSGGVREQTPHRTERQGSRSGEEKRRAGGCMRNGMKSGTSGFFLAWKRQNWPLAGPPNSVGGGWIRKRVSTEAAGCRIDGGRGDQGGRRALVGEFLNRNTRLSAESNGAMQSG